jgi:hypothetical protein
MLRTQGFQKKMAWILGGFWVEEDEGDLEGDVEEEGLADRGAPFIEGDREGAVESADAFNIGGSAECGSQGF